VSASHFDTIANGYDEALPPHVVEHYLRKSTRFVVEHCPRGRGLDVGCGTGVRADRLVRAGYEMVGVDPSQGMLDVATRRAPKVATVNASATSLPFADDTFDLVITVAVLHHIADADDVRQALAEMVRVTKKTAGRIVVWDHNPRNPYWRLLMGRVLQDTGEERLIPERELLEGLRAAGGRILLSRQLSLVPDFTPPGALRVAATVERAVESTPVLRRFAAHNVIVAAN
jgi:ubiquinone/menaquinone biosynthesis C-methylase UbiE